jgi:DNA-binding CsgD family transcriptional regulator
MAGKSKPMSQIKQLMILHNQGKGRKTIARILGISKNTVKTYLEKLEMLQLENQLAKILAYLELYAKKEKKKGSN